jgi:ABC-type transport system involved in multi-copper enzyme maturation permease subunit
MSTTLIPAEPTTAHPTSAAADFTGELSSEWTKIRSVRSTIWALVALVVVTIGFTALFNWLTVSQWDVMADSQHQAVMLDPTGQILGSGFQFSQLAICILGVLIMTGEYSSGTIRATLLAVPRRTPVLAAKALVFAVLVFVVAEISAFVSFLIGAAILNSRVAVSLADPGVLQAIVGIGLYAAMLGVFAIAIGALLRHTAGAITAIIGFVLVLSPLALLLPGDWGRYVYAYLPTNAGQRIATTVQGPTDLLTAWQGFGVFALWTTALIILAGYLLKRRDA